MGKTIVITGAGSGLGRAFARRLAKDGHRIVLLGRRPEKIAAIAGEIGGGAYALACDVTDPHSVDAAFAAISAREERIDVLINNAGVYEPHFIREATNAQVAAMLDTNLAGPVYCSRAAIPLLRKGSHIINIGSKTAAEASAMLTLYQSSKAGLERFSASLRDELAPDGIRVTLLRAAAMMGDDMEWKWPPELAQRFMEERQKIGIQAGNQPVSRFESVAEVLPWLIALPGDVGIPELILDARHP
jgi:meso-butanediol dehydrogenase / (S,S)-butanediol dehydrogenase / diacetyl reductase